MTQIMNNHFKGVMNDSERDLYMRPPHVPVKDVGKRLPPTRTNSLNSQLVSIRESSKEASADIQTPPSVHTSARISASRPDRSTRKKPLISLFPDPSRLQHAKNPPQLRITIPATQEKGESKPVSSGKAPNTATSTTPDEILTGLAKAKHRALEAKRRDSPSPPIENSNPKQPPAAKHTTHTTATPADHPSSSSPTKLRRKLSKQIKRRSRSLESVFESKSSLSFSPEPSVRSTATTPPITVSSSISRGIEIPPSTFTKSSHQLLAAVELKPSKHVRQSRSASSINSDSLTTCVSDDNVDGVAKKRHKRRSSIPTGVTPDQAARVLPSSVKTALGNHAHTESMGYLVLLPHEVVQLNDDHLELEKKIDTIKHELISVRQQSTDLHEKILDELRTFASSSTTDSAALNKLLHLQIDVATVEVKLDRLSRRLGKAQLRRAEVRERLLMHLAGTHAMLECEKQLAAKETTPPESPVQSEWKDFRTRI